MLSGTLIENSGPISSFLFANLKSLGLWLVSNWYWFFGFIVGFVVVLYVYNYLREKVLNYLKR